VKGEIYNNVSTVHTSLCPHHDAARKIHTRENIECDTFTVEVIIPEVHDWEHTRSGGGHLHIITITCPLKSRTGTWRECDG
jgi:hypothetical protein